MAPLRVNNNLTNQQNGSIITIHNLNQKNKSVLGGKISLNYGVETETQSTKKSTSQTQSRTKSSGKSKYGVPLPQVNITVSSPKMTTVKQKLTQFRTSMKQDIEEGKLYDAFLKDHHECLQQKEL